jgi:hypothetical protein
MTPGTGSALSYGFDASGNLTILPAGAAGTYDHDSELASSTLSGVTTSYAYDADSFGSVLELAGKVGAVCLAEPAEGPFGLGSAGRANRIEDASAALGQLDEGGPPIAGIGPPFDQVPGLEGVDDLGGRAHRELLAAVRSGRRKYPGVTAGPRTRIS